MGATRVMTTVRFFWRSFGSALMVDGLVDVMPAMIRDVVSPVGWTYVERLWGPGRPERECAVKPTVIM